LSAAAKDPGDARTMAQLGSAEGVLGNALGRLNVVMEAYPDLKANQNMMQLSEELTSTENRVSFARQSYNDQVTEYNTYKQTFPPVLLAAPFGHGPNASLLEFEDHAAIQEAPKVKFWSDNSPQWISSPRRIAPVARPGSLSYCLRSPSSD